MLAYIGWLSGEKLLLEGASPTVADDAVYQLFSQVVE